VHHQHFETSLEQGILVLQLLVTLRTCFKLALELGQLTCLLLLQLLLRTLASLPERVHGGGRLLLHMLADSFGDIFNESRLKVGLVRRQVLRTFSALAIHTSSAFHNIATTYNLWAKRGQYLDLRLLCHRGT
jgi:hypothetical protein